jgi:hypothetical protein
MGQSCSNCNCNKDERDELRIDDKQGSSQAAGRAQYHYDEQDLSGVAAVFGQHSYV